MNEKHRKSRIVTVRIGETPTQERRSHEGGVRAEIVDRDIANKILMKRYRAVWECPLDAYLDRAAISPLEHRAGQKFRRAYFRAVFGIRVEDVGSGSAGDVEMSMLTPIYSQRILKQAYEAL